MHGSDYFTNMIKKVKDSECCALPVGFDDETNHLLMMNNLAAYRWVGCKRLTTRLKRSSTFCSATGWM
jgi:hypothetical protein